MNTTYCQSLYNAAALILLGYGSASALEFEGYSEPYRSINVAADETGTIEEVFVQEGQSVDAGEPLVRLNSDVYFALLAIAELNMQAEGRLDGAKAEFRTRRERLEQLRSLRAQGHARQEEVNRAFAEVAISTANVQAAQEDLSTRRLEYLKIKTQIDRRTIRAPISGVVTVLHKQVGEFVAPNRPEVLMLVEIDRPLINFTLMSPEAQRLKPNQLMNVRFQANDMETTGTVAFVSPVTDAESGTVLVKVQVENAEGKFRSGERCRIRF